jgi:hypothetical protein
MSPNCGKLFTKIHLKKDDITRYIKKQENCRSCLEMGKRPEKISHQRYTAINWMYERLLVIRGHQGTVD